MNHSRCKTYALALVAIMLFASIPFTVSIYDDGSDAASTIDYTRWYYNQLDEPMKYAYDELLKADITSTAVTIEVPSDVCGKIYNDFSDDNSEKLNTAVNRLKNCLHIERPELYFTEILYKASTIGTIVKEVSLIFKMQDANTSLKNSEVKNTIASLSFTGTTVEKITAIHDYLVNTLSYAVDELAEERAIGNGYIDYTIRSQYKALVGDHYVVCEGYAKSFKVICDYYNIPCLLVAGEADNGSGEPEGHMWNLVYVENSWYTVDVTWDDPVNGNGKIYDIFLLVGQNTVDDKGLTTAKSHSLSRVIDEYGFTLPTPLASNRYGGENVTVSFKTNGGTAIDPITVKSGTIPTIPSTVKYGYIFDGWYLDNSFTVSWNNTIVSYDCTFYAKWIRDTSTVVTYVVTYDNNGGTGGPGTISTENGTITISSSEPTRSGYEFKGWNTLKDGSGTAYKGGEAVTIDDSVTFYAQWSVAPLDNGATETITETFNSFLEKTEEFMNEEAVEGVKNLYLVIGGVAVFLIIAVIAMRR